ncbi:MAG: glycosylasparaginase [Pseudopedobacter saltans]|uniref:Glycosylasparaginase n=1 Tax=Pseudopedobacter saltans TaxID=151895 RepID=A0A2W5F3J1_9SPHI|nr:MAG: glycosylasparaginase [Pseudopedobacter saltans]
MLQRRKFLQLGSLGFGSLFANNIFAAGGKTGKKPLVISTWDAGLAANKDAWQILRSGGRAFDAVEKGVMVTESSINCCVGLGGNPDRDGIVTLDACIMDEFGNAGGVLALERIKHPIAVARRVLEKTPHVYLVGDGAQMFAVEQGFPLEPQKLSDEAEKEYKKWLQKSEYKPQINIEQKQGGLQKGQVAAVPNRLSNGAFNHDTIGMIAIDANGNLSGSCTTSGMAFKMRGRVGDSPIIGAGLYVDNEVGAAVSTGLGEEVIKVCGTHLVVELMRQGYSPENACKEAVRRIVKHNGEQKSKDIQVGFLALNKKGEYGAYCIQSGFSFAVCDSDSHNELIASKHMI